jgi:hypothetical protein
MTPKEKANEIIKKHLIAILDESMDSNRIMFYSAKMCAIVSVKLILDEYNSMSDLETVIVIGEDNYNVIDSIIWWRQVLKDVEEMQD